MTAGDELTIECWGLMMPEGVHLIVKRLTGKQEMDLRLLEDLQYENLVVEKQMKSGNFPRAGDHRGCGVIGD